MARLAAHGGLIIVTAASATAQEATDSLSETQVLVVATVHSQHRRNPNYSHQDVVHILDTFEPDVVCVEIRPQDFRRSPYLQEMMLATVWGIAHGLEVCGFDWFDGTTRERRRALEQTPEYVEKALRLDSLTAINPITSTFDEAYGDYWSGEMSYAFYNGVEYNRYHEEAYRLSLAVYGDDPVNLMYETRNRHMMQLAWEVIRRHPGKKIAMLTGAEHKHYFDRDLRTRPGIRVVEFDEMLPFVERPLHPTVAAFIQEGDDLPYYDRGFPLDTAAYYRGKLTNLVHGPDMDWRPDIIPRRNVEVAARVLSRWRAHQPVSPRMIFEEGWLHFLEGDCDASIERYSDLVQMTRQSAVHDPFLVVYTYRNLGLCHDLSGNREAALLAYARARELAPGTRMERSVDLMLRDFENTPYRRGRAREPFGR
jgi:tetratricopeptide (TPR) repeat protein